MCDGGSGGVLDPARRQLLARASVRGPGVPDVPSLVPPAQRRGFGAARGGLRFRAPGAYRRRRRGVVCHPSRSARPLRVSVPISFSRGRAFLFRSFLWSFISSFFFFSRCPLPGFVRNARLTPISVLSPRDLFYGLFIYRPTCAARGLARVLVRLFPTRGESTAGIWERRGASLV